MTDAETVLPGRLSIHPTEWFMSHATASVPCPTKQPMEVPPKAMVSSPKGTKTVAKGRTMRFVSRKYEENWP